MTEVRNRDGVNLYVEDSGGSGRPVVLIHGWPLSAESWAHQTPTLAEAGYRVVAYDRRGFGRSDKPDGGYEYDTLARDLADVLESLDLRDATLVGFSMGGGEVARYLSAVGPGRIRSVVFAAAVPPYMMQSEDNPDGPLTPELAEQMEQGLTSDREAFFDQFTTDFFTADGQLAVDETERQEAIRLARQADQTAAVGCMRAFGTTDFRGDLEKVTVPTLVLHGTADGTVPFEGSGQRTHQAISGSELRLIEGGPHGINASHPAEFNAALLEFLTR